MAHTLMAEQDRLKTSMAALALALESEVAPAAIFAAATGGGENAGGKAWLLKYEKAARSDLRLVCALCVLTEFIKRYGEKKTLRFSDFEL
jgi:hypothetical protein